MTKQNIALVFQSFCTKAAVSQNYPCVNPPRFLHPVLASLRRAAHSLAERGASRHLFGEDERDLAPPARLLASGGNRDVSLTAVARAMTLVCLFSYRPAEAQHNKSTSRPGLSKQQTVSAGC